LNIVFAGTPEFATATLAALLQSAHTLRAVYTQPDRPAGRGRKVAMSPVKQLAIAHRIAVEQPASLRETSAVDTLRSYEPDVLVVVAYGLILPRDVLAIPKLGCINVHASLLPRWRGAAPIQHALLAGDARTGVAIMRMEAGLDTGPVYLERAIEIDLRDSSATLQEKLATLGANALIEVLQLIEQGLAVAQPQPESGITYASKISKEHARIDWSRSAVEIDRQIRAFDPAPVAFTHWKGEPLRIWAAQLERSPPEQADWQGAPGAVVAIKPQGPVVATGDGWLTLTRLQLPGRKAMTAADVMRAHGFIDEVFQ
jgi:methionyl-tRNA formyltransferase